MILTKTVPEHEEEYLACDLCGLPISEMNGDAIRVLQDDGSEVEYIVHLYQGSGPVNAVSLADLPCGRALIAKTIAKTGVAQPVTSDPVSVSK